MARDTDKVIREYLAAIGSKGGKTRAKKYDKATLRKWAKLGGRPPNSGKATKSQTRQPKAGAKE